MLHEDWPVKYYVSQLTTKYPLFVYIGYATVKLTFFNFLNDIFQNFFHLIRPVCDKNSSSRSSNKTYSW